MLVLYISKKKLTQALAIIGLSSLMALSLWFSQPEPDVQVLSYVLASRVIVIDPGHGGIDPGTIGRKLKIPEKEVTLAIAKRLANLLSQAGAMVVMTRDTDRDLSDAGFKGSFIERKRQDLARRVDLAHRVNAELYISIHANADPSPRWHGAQVFYYSNSLESKMLATAIQDELVRILGNNNRKAKEGVFFIMEKTRIPAVTVEVGFMSNEMEERLLADELYQSKVAHAIFSGLVKYYVAKEEKP